MDQLYKYNGITLRRMNRVQFKEHYFQRKQKRSQAFDDQRFLMACDDSLNEEQPENAEKELNSNIKCRGKTRIPVRCVSKTCDGTRRILTCVTEEKPKPFVVGKVRHKIHSPPFLHNPLKTSEAKTPYLPMTYQSVIPENYKFTAPKGLPHFKYTTPKTSENSPFTLKSLLLPRIKRFTNSPLEQEHTERSLHKVKRELWIDEEPPIFGRTNVAKALEKEYNKDLDSQDGVAIVPSTSNSVQKMCTNSNIDSEKIEKSVSMSFEFEKDESFVDKENISSNDVRKTEKATQYSSQMDELQTSLKYFDADANREVEKENQAEAVEKSINRLNESKSSKQISESCVPTRYQSHIPVKHHGSISMHEGITKIQKISSSSTLNTKKDTSHPLQLNQSLTHASSKNFERETDSDEKIENQAKTVEHSDSLLDELKTDKSISEYSVPTKEQPNTKVSYKGSLSMQKTVSESPKRLLNKSSKIKIATPHPSQLNKSSAHASSKSSERETDSDEEIENQATTVEHSDSLLDELKTDKPTSESSVPSKLQSNTNVCDKVSRYHLISITTKNDTPHLWQLNKSSTHASSKIFERETDSDEEIENQAKTVEHCDFLLDELKTDKSISEYSVPTKEQPNTKVSYKGSLLMQKSVSESPKRLLNKSLKIKIATPHPSQLNKSSAHASSKNSERETDSDEEIENQAKKVEHIDTLLDKLKTDKSISEYSVPTKEQSNTKVSHKGSLSLHEGIAEIQKISSSSTLDTKKDTSYPSQLNQSLTHASSKNFEREINSNEQIENQAESVEQMLDELKTVKATCERSEHLKLQSHPKACHKGSLSMQKTVSESPKRLLNKSSKIKIATPHPSQLKKSSAHASSKSSERETDSDEEIENQAKTVEHSDSLLDELKTDKPTSESSVPSKQQLNAKVCHKDSLSMQKTVSESPKRLLNKSSKTKIATPHSSQLNKSSAHASSKSSERETDSEEEIENQATTVEHSDSLLDELKTDKPTSESSVPSKLQSNTNVCDKIFERETDSDEEIENHAETVEQSDYLLDELKTVKPVSEYSVPTKEQPNTKVSCKGSPLMQKSVFESPKRLLNKSLKIKIATPHSSQLNKSSTHASSKIFERETDSDEEIENHAETVEQSDYLLNELKTVKPTSEISVPLKQQLNAKVCHKDSLSMQKTVSESPKRLLNKSSKIKIATPHSSQLNKSSAHASSKSSERETDSEEEIENQATTVEHSDSLLDELKTDKPTSESSVPSKLQSNTNVCDKVSRYHLISITTKNDTPHLWQLNKSSTHASSKIFERETDSDEEIENHAETVEQSDYLLDELKTVKPVSEYSVPTKEQPNTKVSCKGSPLMQKSVFESPKRLLNKSLKIKIATPHSSQLNKSSTHASSKIFERETDSDEEIENHAETVEQSDYLLNELKTVKPTSEISVPLKQQLNAKVCHKDSLSMQKTVSESPKRLLNKSSKIKIATPHSSQLNKSSAHASSKSSERETDSDEEIENQATTVEHSDSLLDELKTDKPTSESSVPSKLQSNTNVCDKVSRHHLISITTKNDTPHPSQLNKSSAHASSKIFERETDSDEEIENHAETVEQSDYLLDELKTVKPVSEYSVPTKEQPNTKVSCKGSPLMQKSVFESPKRLLNKSLKIKISTPHPSQLNKSSVQVSFKNFERDTDSDEQTENRAKTVEHSDCRHHDSISMHEGDTKIQTSLRNSVLETKKDSPRPSQVNNSLISYIKSKIWGLVTDSEAEIENQFEDRVEQSVMNESTTGKLIAESLVPSKKQSNTKVSHDGSISTLVRTKDDSIHPLRLNKSLSDPPTKHSEKFQVRQAEVKNHVFTDEHCVPSSNVLTTNKPTIENLILSNKKSNTNICNKPLVSMSKGVPIIQNTSECMMHSNKQLNHKITGQDSITFSEGVSTFPKMIIECTRSPERIAKKIEKLCDGLDECPITVLKKPSEKIMKTEVIDLVSDEEEEDSYKTFIQRVLNNCAKHQRLSNACATSPLLNSKTNISPVETPKVGRRNKKEASANSSLVASHLTPKTNVIPVETPKVGRRKKKEASANFSASALPHTPKINISPAKTPKVVGRKKKEASANSSLRPSLVTPQTNISPVKTPKVGRRKKKEASENSSPGPFLLTTQTNISPVKTPKVVGRKKKEASENSSMGPSLLIPEINISPAKTPKVVGRKKKEALANSSPGTSLLTPVRVLSLRSRNVEVSPSPSKSTPRRRRKKDEVRV
uniref:Uncharacterized protein n=1 Tax=Trichogramma kaykai TaxID=54128 RepID=A0ABD2W4J8_9HYME